MKPSESPIVRRKRLALFLGFIILAAVLIAYSVQLRQWSRIELLVRQYAEKSESLTSRVGQIKDVAVDSMAARSIKVGMSQGAAHATYILAGEKGQVEVEFDFSWDGYSWQVDKAIPK